MSSIPSSKPAPRGCRILCVDDEPAIREVLGLLLQREGHHVESAANGAAGWLRLSQDLNAFDVVITDNEMPLMTGLELIHKLRAAPFAGKIIVFSSSLTPPRRERLAKLGVDAVVEKGSPMRDLLAAIRRATGT